MMWRWTVLALVAANGGFWLWRHGELRAFGWGPIEVSEPGRLQTQIQPDMLRLTPQAPAATLAPEAVPNASPALTPAAPPLAPTAAPPVPSSVSTPALPPDSSPTQGK